MNKKSAIVFSHFDANNEIDEYVFYYLEKLREVSDYIVLVSDCPRLRPGNIIRAKKIVREIITERHGEYDFGSYKRGYTYLCDTGAIRSLGRLIFANDSVFGPFESLNSIFGKMAEKSVDFWGMTFSDRGYARNNGTLTEATVPHLQSYFLVFNDNVFRSNPFRLFMDSIRPEKDKFDVILKYELGLTSILAKNGFKYDSFVSKELAFADTHSIFKMWKTLIMDQGLPFIKYQAITAYNADYSILADRYPVKLIENNIRRRRRNEKKAAIKRKIARAINKCSRVLRCLHLRKQNKIIHGKGQ